MDDDYDGGGEDMIMVMMTVDVSYESGVSHQNLLETYLVSLFSR